MSLLTPVQIQAAAELELRKRRSEKLANFSTQQEYYRTDPLQWMEDRLGIKKETIKKRYA